MAAQWTEKIDAQTGLLYTIIAQGSPLSVTALITMLQRFPGHATVMTHDETHDQDHPLTYAVLVRLDEYGDARSDRVSPNDADDSPADGSAEIEGELHKWLNGRK